MDSKACLKKEQSTIHTFCINLLKDVTQRMHTLLTHLCREDSSTLTHWTCPFPIEGVPGYLIITKFYRNSMQTVQTLIRRRRMRRLIWVYAVCQCAFYFYGTPGINGLVMYHIMPCIVSYHVSYHIMYHMSRREDYPDNRFLLFLYENVRCGYSLEASRRGACKKNTHNIHFCGEIKIRIFC